MQDDRRLAVLRAIVEDYVATREPVGSKALVERHRLGVSPATVRNDMASLEEEGLIAQPHTSAGRIPTDSGYRFYVDELLSGDDLPAVRARVELTDIRREVDDAMRATTEQLSQVTNLLALVSAPPIDTATIHRVEVLLLQPNVAMDPPISRTATMRRCNSHLMPLPLST